MATFAVKTEHHSMGSLHGVTQQITGDGSTQTWDTGLSYVLFYIATTPDDAHCITDEWYYNYSDAGSTTANGHVHFDEAAPDDGEVWTCFGIGR